MYGTRSIEHHAWQQLTFDSWSVGWRALSLRSYVQNDDVDAVIPASGEQKITMLMTGHKRVDVLGTKGWRHAEVAAGSISLTRPGRATRIRWRSTTPRPLRHLTLHVPEATMVRTGQQLWDTVPVPTWLPDGLDVADPFITALMPALARSSRSGADDTYAQAAAERLAVHLLTRDGRRVTPHGPYVGPHRLDDAITVLHDHYRDPISRADLAVHTGLSTYHFLRVFRDLTGLTPHQYLVQLRMTEARVLLSTSNDPIVSIAARVGYEDGPQFARAFRQHHNCSPSTYRRTHTP